MMEEQENQAKNEELFSKAVRAGKRTYFFDVKATKGNEKYLTITESKRRYIDEQGHYQYDKHKIFLYKEDFDKFVKAVNDSINFIATGEYPADYDEPVENVRKDEGEKNLDEWFDNLEK